MPIEHMDMKHPKIIVAGIGPGNESDITPAVISALQESDVVVGYKYYFQFVTPYLHPSTTCIDTGMKRERAGRAGKDGLRHQFRGCGHLWYDAACLRDEAGKEQRRGNRFAAGHQRFPKGSLTAGSSRRT